MGYRRSRFEDELAAAGTVVIIVAVVIAIAILVTLSVAILSELVRIYRTRAGQPTRTGQILRWGLGVILGIWVLAGLALLHPVLAPSALIGALWATFIWVLVVEWCDWSARRDDPVPIPVAELTLPQVLGPWSMDGMAPAPSNGHRVPEEQRA